MNAGMHKEPAAAVVASGNHVMALLPIRALGRRGIPVVCAFGQGGFHQYARVVRSSRFISQKLDFDETDYETGLVACLCEFGKSAGRKSVLLPVSDRDMITVSAHRETLREYYHLLMPPHEMLEALLNKHLFSDLARERELPVPMSFRLDSKEDIERVARDITYPCIIKPPWRDEVWLSLYANQKVVLVNNAEQLTDACRRLCDHFGPLTIQEVIGGDERNIVCSFAFIDERSEPLAMFTSCKVRQYPPHFGNSSLVERVVEPVVEELTVRIAKQLGLVGYVGIEFKKDPRDGKFKILEITPCRFNRQAGLSEEVGISLPYAWYCHLLGQAHKCEPSAAECQWLSEVNELRSFREYRRRREYTVTEWIKSYRNLKQFEVFAMDDLLPFAMIFPSAMLRRLRGSQRHVTRR